MIEITQEEFESNFDSYMDEVENNKKEFLIRMPDGRGVVMAPFDDETKNFVDKMIDQKK